jgi:hypothetical protein
MMSFDLCLLEAFLLFLRFRGLNTLLLSLPPFLFAPLQR